LYEIVSALEPLKTCGEEPPEPEELKVTEFATEPDEPVMLAFIEVVETAYSFPLFPAIRPENVPFTIPF